MSVFNDTDKLLEAVLNEALGEVDAAWSAAGVFFSVEHALDRAERVFWREVQKRQVRATSLPTIKARVQAIQRASSAEYQAILNSIRTTIQNSDLGPQQKARLAAAIESAVMGRLQNAIIVKEQDFLNLLGLV